MSDMKHTYAAYSIDEHHKALSSSGGIFYELASSVISSGGVVYGVSMSTDNRSAEYVRATSLTDLEYILGSKYMQARINDTFKKVKKDLVDGLTVLFSGTGCTVNGLKSFLTQDYDNLLCVDVICHGVPSPKVWKKYIGFLEAKEKSSIVKVNFRCKDNGWENYCLSIENDRAKKKLSFLYDDPYMQMFLRNYDLRPSCYNCKAKPDHRADITLGDFWGVNEVAQEMNNGRGTSVVILRSNNGLRYFKSIEPSVKYREVEYSLAVKGNPSEFGSVAKPTVRDAFFADLDRLSFRQLTGKYIDITYKQKLKRIMLQTPLKRMIGRR